LAATAPPDWQLRARILGSADLELEVGAWLDCRPPRWRCRRFMPRALRARRRFHKPHKTDASRQTDASRL